MSKTTTDTNIGPKHMALPTGILMFLGLIAITEIGLADSWTRSCSSHCSRCEDGDCRECYYGYWSHNCESECVKCWLGGCKKHSGECEQCEPGRYGGHCQFMCSVHCRPLKFEDVAHCQRHSGKCLEGCEVSRWGSTCQYSCSSGCQGACFQEDGACIFDCTKGYFGTHCNRSCSDGCALGTCDWLTGVCHGGCKCGYKGDTCVDVCSKTCTVACRQDSASNCFTCPKCGINCKICNLNSKCLQCQNGWFGQDCELKCTRNSGMCINREDELQTTQNPSVGNTETFTAKDYDEPPTDSEAHTVEKSGFSQGVLVPTLALCITRSIS